MIHTLFGIVECSIFMALSGLHFYWFFGGKWGLEEALPTNEKGVKVLNPGKIETAVVAFGLLAFGIFYLLESGLISMELPKWVREYGGWFIVLIFIARTIGDFNYVGIFKRIKNTEFAKRDTKYYAPLCLFIALIGMLLELN